MNALTLNLAAARSVPMAALMALLASVAPTTATAGVSIDSFNSANAALAPSGGMDDETLQRRSRRGPADALIEFTHRQRVQQAREDAQAAASRPAGPPVAAVDATLPRVGTR